MTNSRPSTPPNSITTPLRVILLLKSTTYRAGPFFKAAERLGLEIIKGLDIDPRLAEQWQVSLPLQFDQPEQAAATIVNFARKTPVSSSQSIIAIMTTFCDSDTSSFLSSLEKLL